MVTFSLVYAFFERFILPLSHDEVVHGKKSLLGRMAGDYWQKFAGLRTLYCLYLTHPGKKICFMGTELAPFIEWRCYEELEWFLLGYEMHRDFQKFVADANRLYKGQSALWANDYNWNGFEWIDCNNNKQSIFVFVRGGIKEEDHLLVILNMTPAYYPAYKVGVPIEPEPIPEKAKAKTKAQAADGEPAKAAKTKYGYMQVFNSDDSLYGGSGKGNPEIISAVAESWHGRPASIVLEVPPLSGIILKPVKLGRKK